MDYTTDINGKKVIAEGAPGSLARMRCEYPVFVKSLNDLLRSWKDEADKIAKFNYAEDREEWKDVNAATQYEIMMLCHNQLSRTISGE